MGQARSSMTLPYKIIRELLDQRASMKPVLGRVVIAFNFLLSQGGGANIGRYKPLKIVRAVPVRFIAPNGAVLNRIESC